MHRLHPAKVLLFAAAIFGGSAGSLRAGNLQYVITSLGVLGGTPTEASSQASGINSSGQISGWATASNGDPHAFYYDGQMHDLGSVLTNGLSYGYGINDQGVVVGMSDDTYAFYNASHTTSGNVTLTQPGSLDSAAFAINNDNLIAGNYGADSFNAFIFQDPGGPMQILGDLNGVGDTGLASNAYAINDAGTLVGTAQDPNFIAPEGSPYKPNRAMVFSGGVMTALPLLPGDSTIDGGGAYAINSSGVIVGQSGLDGTLIGGGNGQAHAVLWNSEGVMSLGSLAAGYGGFALGINDAAQIVGEAGTPSGAHAFIYMDGQMTDLNTLAVPGSGFITLVRATAINNSGSIVGYGYLSSEGAPMAFLATPTIPTTNNTPPSLTGSGGGSSSTTANFSIDATKAVRTVDDRVFGLNTAVWDSYLNTPPTLSLLAAAGTRALRFPGGSTADTYTWSQSDTDNFAAVAQGINANAFITVNYGTGTPTQAAAWVQYANITKGYAFKYWEVGNENYGTWETDNNAPAHDPLEYATRFVLFYKAMKAADSTIRVGAVAPTSTEGAYNFPSEGVTNPMTGQKDTTWIAILLSTLKTNGVTPDFLICHRYEQQAGQESDAGLLQATDTAGSGWQADAAELRTPLNDYLGSAAAGVELCVTENNSVHNNPGKQTTSLVNGLYMADAFGNVLQTEFNSMIWWDLRNGPPSPVSAGNNGTGLYGWRTFGDYGVLATTPSPLPSTYSALNTPYPTYYVQKLLSHFVGNGDAVIKAASDQSLLSVYAAKRVDGSLTLLVINKDPANVWTGNIGLTGFTPASSKATIYSYGITQDNAANPASSTYGIASPDVAQSTLSGVAASFSTSFAPYSVNVIAIAPVPAFASQPANVEVNTGSTAVFTAPATGSPTYQWEVSTNGGTTWSLLSDGGNISGSTGPQLVITNTSSANTGEYEVVATNSGGAATSNAAALQVSSSSNPGLATSISTRAFVGTGDNILIGGFFVVGSTSRTVLVQGLGPALGQFGVTGFLAHPTLSIHQTQNGSDATLYSNTGWGSSQVLLNAAASVFASPTLPPGSPDSELLLTLPPGGYSAEVSGADGGSGVALCAIYELP